VSIWASAMRIGASDPAMPRILAGAPGVPEAGTDGEAVVE
jgi:hypothetical protein